MPAPLNHPSYAGCETGGRPRKYSIGEIEAFADEFIAWMKIPTNIWFKDFCLDRNIDPDLMAEWAIENDKFNGAYRLAKHRQESRLLNGGLMNQYNSSIVKFVLANAHGWTEKQEAKVSGNAADTLPTWLAGALNKSMDLVNEDSKHVEIASNAGYR